MEDIFYNLYLGKTNGIPKDENGKEFTVVYCIEENEKITPELEKNQNLRYFSIILQKTKTDLKNAILNVKSEWNNFSDLTLELEHITDDLKNIKKDFRELLLNCENETVIFKTQVVGFDEKDKIGFKEARKMITGVSTKPKWNIWS